ncbi:hypothetical protein F511_47028 [Dorcoceras hygrometricum]|uniref:Uncharacterized protein n=1 Tax=Dorcoceras hygrometricum TaxID=472368 RepID=A0A2Z6ZS01_9LAMI|nr:hypothetical protein F511_47028 [Dorcoceras hygrometricum]
MSARDACALAVHGARPLACVQRSVVRWRPLPRDDVAPLVVRWPHDWSLVAGRWGALLARWWSDDAPLIGASSVVSRACRGRAWPCAARDFRGGVRRLRPPSGDAPAMS